MPQLFHCPNRHFDAMHPPLSFFFCYLFHMAHLAWLGGQSFGLAVLLLSIMRLFQERIRKVLALSSGVRHSTVLLYSILKFDPSKNLIDILDGQKVPGPRSIRLSFAAPTSGHLSLAATLVLHPES